MVRASPTWRPTLWAGFREVIGSWKTNEIWRPLTCRSRRDESVSRSTPSNIARPLITAVSAAAFGVSDLGTKGGLRTDTDGRVLDAEDRPIPGLYAAGNTMAAVSGTTYPAGGNPIGASLLFSHRAALHMAR